jgi:hypothetical protein
MEDEDMWEEYRCARALSSRGAHGARPTRARRAPDARATPTRRYILSALRSAGFVPFYSSKQPDGEYLKVQVGTQALHSRYEVAYGNINF